MGLLSCVRGIDPDDLFAYNTIKTVTIRDRYLGFLRVFLLLGIFIYIVVKVIIFDKAYNIHDTPIGFVRTSLQFPPDGVDMRTLLYCPNNANHTDWPFPQELDQPCRVWDANSIIYPPDEVNSIFVTTRITETVEVYKCGSQNTPDNPKAEDTCDMPYETTSSFNYFLAGVEKYTLGLQHSFQSNLGKKKKISGNSKNYDGKLIGVDGKVYKYFPASSTGDKPDILTVEELLTAAGASFVNPSRDPNNSQLYSGMVVIVVVSYVNDPHISYEYRASVVKQADYKLYEVRYDALATQTRNVFKRAGPKFVFLTSGDMATFDFQQLLLQLVSALGLLSVATMVVELVMLYLLPLRKYYSKAKFEITADFSDLRRVQSDNHDAPVDDLNTNLLDIRETGDYTPYPVSMNDATTRA